MIYTVKDRKETFALCEVFHELSAATSRLERERVRTVYITREAASIGYSQSASLLAHNRIATIVACQLELVNSN